jgi:IS605 OrfB family transposase
MSEPTKTIQVRLKDKHAKMLNSQAREVNMVWNFVNETSMKILEREQRFCSAYDLDKYTAGATKEGISLHSQTVQAIGAEYVIRRKQFKKRRLNWRKSGGSKRSLGWIPFKKSAISYRNGQLWYQGKPLNTFENERLSQYELGTGSFSEDAKGRWYFNATVKVAPKQNTSSKSVGLDLGLKETVVSSDGHHLTGRNYRRLESKLAMAQRANKKKLVKTIHSQIKNRRKDELHKFSTMLTQEYGVIFVGDVSSQKLIKTKMAKSVLDAGWSQLKTMLEYKSHWAGVVYEEVNERYTTQVCSCCGSIPDSSPKGRADLNKRDWVCSDCGTSHQRDENSALNILRIGQDALVLGTPRL